MSEVTVQVIESTVNLPSSSSVINASSGSESISVSSPSVTVGVEVLNSASIDLISAEGAVVQTSVADNVVNVDLVGAIVGDQSGAPVPIPINALTDVDTVTSPPAVGNTLVWDGFFWVPASPQAPPSELNDLTDVDTVTTPPDVGSSLTWTGSEWAPGSIPLPEKNFESKVLEVSLTSGQKVETSIEAGRQYYILGYTAAHAGIRIRGYVSDTYRDFDLSRPVTEDPLLNGGVLFELVTEVGTHRFSRMVPMYATGPDTPFAIEHVSGLPITSTVTLFVY
jgi:hypothetical protein